MVTLNINEMVRFFLTKHGANVYNDYTRRIGGFSENKLPCNHYEGEECVMELWYAMEVFGPYMSSICERGPLFKGNKITCLVDE